MSTITADAPVLPPAAPKRGNALRMGAAMLGVLGGLLGLGIALLGWASIPLATGFDDTKGQLGALAVYGPPAASILGGLLALATPGVGCALMLVNTVAVFALYGLNAYSVSAFVLSGLGCVMAFLASARADVSVRGEPRPLIAPLGTVYGDTRELAYLVVRLAAGGMLLVHGVIKVLPMWDKGFTATIEAFAAGSMARRGIEPAIVAAYVIFFMETIGAICIMLGLFTRIFAAAAVVEFLVIVFHATWAQGFAWNTGGWEYPLFWGLIMFAIALRGGGPYTLDRKLGWEL
jgi:putative oxidoreductase